MIEFTLALYLITGGLLGFFTVWDDKKINISMKIVLILLATFLWLPITLMFIFEDWRGR